MSFALVPGSLSGHVNAIRDNAPQYWREVSNLTVRNYLQIYNMRKYGALTFNAKAMAQVWNARAKMPTILPAIDGQPIEFTNWDTDIQFYIGYKGYRGSDILPEAEALQNIGSPNAITNRYDRKSKELAEAMVRHVATSFYLDGNDTANAAEMTGIKTALAYDSATCGAADRIAQANGTYAGQSCVLGNLGGSWSSGMATKPNANLAKDWPMGQGSTEYDATTPLIVNYAANSWGTAATTWAANAIAATSYAQSAMLSRGGQSMVGAMPQVVMASDMFPDFKNSFRTNNRQIMPFRDGDLGYPGETLMVDGMVYSMAYEVPVGEAYMYLPQYAEAFFLHPEIYGARGPEYSMPHGGHLYFVSSYGNYKFAPKYLCRFVSETS